ncbi:hypothetical protein MZM54_01440 [[Brevibacterium] frigoritolerans]|nr:hypothetical protein [Peribacillus frigoritolerans]
MPKTYILIGSEMLKEYQVVLMATEDIDVLVDTAIKHRQEHYDDDQIIEVWNENKKVGEIRPSDKTSLTLLQELLKI